jgi:hypothetical protein
MVRRHIKSNKTPMKNRLLHSALALVIYVSFPAIAIDTSRSGRQVQMQETIVKEHRPILSTQTSMNKLSDPSKLPTVQWALLVLQLLTLVGLIVTVWKTWEMAVATQKAANATADTVEEMRLARESASAPHIVVYLASPRTNIAEIIVENFGEGTAKDVHLRFEPSLQSSLSKDVGRFFDSPKWLPPRSRLSHAFDVWSAYFASELPSQYAVKVDYVGVSSGRKYHDEYLLDMGSFRHMATWVKKDLGNVVQEIERLANSVNMISKYVERIHDATQLGGPHEVIPDTMEKAIRQIGVIRESLSNSTNNEYFPRKPLQHALKQASLIALINTEEDELREALLNLYVRLHNTCLTHGIADKKISQDLDEAISSVLALYRSRKPSV